MIPGNLDPWAGPVDPDATAKWRERFRAEAKRDARNQDPCGCWRGDCGECGAKLSDGKRPAQGQVRRFTRACR